MSYTWVASLSDGQRLSMRDLITDDKLNPWDKVVSYVKKKNLDITHVELIVNGRRYNSPSMSKNAKFPTNEKVSGFWIFFRTEANLDPVQEAEEFIAFSYRKGDYRHFFWVNLENSFCYTQIMNVVNPETRLEKDYASIDAFIEKEYSG